MAKSKSRKFYAVAKGRVPGIYNTWVECEAQVKGYQGARYKSFPTRDEAESFIRSNSFPFSSSSPQSNPFTSCDSSTSFTSANSPINRSARDAKGVPVAEACNVAYQQDRGIYVDPRCQLISNYNLNHPEEVERDKTQRTNGHIGSGLVSRVYAVSVGQKPGVYAFWKDCERQIKGYPRASFKSFYTLDEALSFIQPSSGQSSAQAKKRCSTSVEDNTSHKRTRDNITNGRESPDLEISIHFDGGSRGNPGVAGAGAEVKVTTKEKLTSYLIREYCGERHTNNFAEYSGMIAGLTQAKLCIENYFSTNDQSKSALLSFRLIVNGDSNLVIQQMNGCWQCKNDNIKPLYNKALKLANYFKNAVAELGAKCLLSFHHVYRDQNKVADELANEAMDQKRSWTTSTEEMLHYGKAEAVKNESCDTGKEVGVKNEVIELDDSDSESVVSC
ncbi:hypothetical protein HJC23_002344 [Cyclotella cryptica]|uniref:Ribonuclease H n=1 Tax=Cyclotella cryptica TaxID=29204 RepID=A0ABD3QN67_9STRA|eukprot:CCRYP_004438-RA/>CCRYP_004438-RA protein AED:0.22 eAED:0.22 QI:184/1/1/1/1/1/4/1113/444